MTYFPDSRLEMNREASLLGSSVTWTPRLVCHALCRYEATGSLRPPALYEYLRFAVSLPVGSYCVSSDLACAASNFESGSAPSPREPTRPLVISPPVAGAHWTSWQTVVARPALSTARAKAVRRPLAAADSPTNGPPVAVQPTLKLSHVVRPFGFVRSWLANCELPLIPWMRG